MLAESIVPCPERRQCEMVRQSVAAMAPIGSFLGEAEAPSMWKEPLGADGIVGGPGGFLVSFADLAAMAIDSSLASAKRCWL